MVYGVYFMVIWSLRLWVWYGSTVDKLLAEEI